MTDAVRAALVIVGDEAIAWANYGTIDELPHIQHRKQYRLSIVSGPGLTGTVMISPADRDRFLNELASKAGLKRVGDRLERG